MIAWMAIHAFQCSCRLPQTTVHPQFFPISLTQLISMVCLPELGVIRGEKTDSFRIFCSVTLIGGHKEGVALPVEVFTTSELSVYGGMFTMVALATSTVSSVAWKQQVSWTLTMSWT